MTTLTLAAQRIEIAKAQDFTLEFRIRAPEKVVLGADALTGTTTLVTQPLDDALISGDKLLFGRNTVITLSGSAAAGVIAVGVGALVGPLRNGELGQRIRDLTGYTINWEVLEKRGDATPLITKAATLTDPTNGLCQVAGLAADTSALEPGQYYWALWRRNAGSARPLAEGDLVLMEKGFL